jgi:PIN domain nuclease of toxin-antitoxin system
LRYLLDTHSLLWFLSGDAGLTEKARRIIENADHDTLVSIASLWEIAIKHSLGKLKLTQPFEEIFPHHPSVGAPLVGALPEGGHKSRPYMKRYPSLGL